MWGLIGVLAFSFTVPYTRVAVGGLSPLFIGSGRAVIAALLAAAALALTRQRLPRGMHWVRLAVVAGGVVVGFPLLTSYALTTAPASHGAVVIAVLPAATAVMAVIRGHERPPLTLRVNCRAGTRDALLARFAAEGVEATAAGAEGIIVDPPRPVTALPGFADGAFAVQDLGAQLAAPILDPQDGMRVLDACAAPGGKATHLLECADIELVALDRDEVRLERVRQNLARLGATQGSVQVVAGDAGTPSAWWDGRPFERILADVPCTASGIVRRHPDAKWLRRKSDLADLAGQQRGILQALWPLLANGGLLLYATCSVFAGENEQRVGEFLAETPGALRETIRFDPEIPHDGGQLLPSGKGTRHNQDGFFYALLRKA